MRSEPSQDPEGTRWTDQLHAAEEQAPRVLPKPLTLADLEERRQAFEAKRQLIGFAAVLLALGCMIPFLQRSNAPERTAPIAQVESALHGLAKTLAPSTRSDGATMDATVASVARHRANVAIERALTSEFRVNFRLAEAGIASAWVNLHELSRKHPNSHGGRSAHAYIASHPSPAVQDQER